MSVSIEIELYEDGWVFLLGGSNSVREYWVGEKAISSNVLENWNCRFLERRKFINSIGAVYAHVVAPEKLSVYPEKTDIKVKEKFIPSLQIERALDESLRSSSWINPINYLKGQKQKYKVYSKTDSHWSFYGAYSVYQLVQAKLGLPVNKGILDASVIENWTTMDLGGKFDPPLKEEVYFYKLSSSVKQVFSNELVKFKQEKKLENVAGLHVGSYVIYQNEAPVADKVLMLFGDSFSEYRGHLLTGMLAETYREVHFIWSGNFDLNLIARVKPDIVISEFAERFMTEAVPSDDFDLDGYSTECLAKYIESNPEYLS